MDATDGSRNDARGRWIAVLAASVAVGVLEGAHNLAREGSANTTCVFFAVLSVFLELAALTFVFSARPERRLGIAWACVLTSLLGIAIGIVEAFAAKAIERRTGVVLIGGGAAWGVKVTTAVGALDGWLVLGVWALAVVYPFAVIDAKARAAEADRLRTTAELARLRAHLQPHFLLNTLNTVAGLVSSDPREARNLLGALGDLLRDSLEETDEMQTIDDEVKWLMRYAGILETRHKGALTFRWEIDDATRTVRVPRLLLQPLLENAVKHGALRRREGGEIAVRTTLDAKDPRKVTCVIEDNGPGPSAKATRPGALGLHIVTRRLALKYAGAAAFRLESDAGLTRSVVEIPVEAAS
jgi:hypothetical protein